MKLYRRKLWILIATLLALCLVTVGIAAARAGATYQIQQPDIETDHETVLEQERAREAEQQNAPVKTLDALFSGNAFQYPLFIGVDDPNVPAYMIDPSNNDTVQAFVGTQVWGSAYDLTNNRILFNSGTFLYEWPVGGTVNLLGQITDPGGSPMTFVGLAWYDDTLFAARNIANEGVYTIDLSTFVATVYIDYVDAEFDFGGVDADPNDGSLYATNDTASPHGTGLFRINLDGSGTLIELYPAGQTDIDGLAVSDDGYAYLVTDEPGSIYVYDFSAGDYTTPLNNPWTTSETFAGGAFIYEPEPSISLRKTVGLNPSACSNSNETFVTAGSDVTYCYNVLNTGDVTLTLHTLEDSQLGTILLDFPYSLVPGSSGFLTQSQVITAAVVNTATWTAYNPGPSDVVSDTDTAKVNLLPAACPAGYEEVLVASADFEDFPPYGWTITNTTTDCDPGVIPEWTNLDPGGRGNLTGGSGSFAIADSDACGSGSLMNTTMTSAPLNFSGLVSPTITFFTDYNDINIGGDSADLDVSLDGGLTWQNLLSWDDDVRGPLLAGASLPGAGEDDVRVRWDYQNASWDWWWEVDDIRITACGQFPEIEVAPQEITGTQPTDQVVTHTLTISNLGTATLYWEFAESDDLFGAAASPMPEVEQTVIENKSSQLDLASADRVESPLQVPDSIPLSPFIASPALLYDNGPLVNCTGCGVGGADESVLQNISLGMNVLGFGFQYVDGHRLADDFTVEDEGGWYIDELTFFGYETGSSPTSTISAANLRIWNGSPDDPGSSVIYGDTLTNRLIESSWSGIYRVTEETTGASTERPVMGIVVDVNTFLPPGTYWLDWQVHGVPGLNGPFAPPITIDGETTTGNALQYSGAWAPVVDVGQQGFPFLVYGCAVGETPWVSSVPPFGNTQPGEASDVSVLFDSTGLGFGVYSGELCLWSSDPDETITTVPLTLTVVPAADLSVTKTASKEPVALGENFEYTLLVENAGPDPANNVVLVDTLPSVVTFVSASAGCSEAAGVVTCDLGALAAGAATEVSIVVSAPDEEGIITNSASVSADELDINLQDNSVSLDTTVTWLRVYLPLIVH